MERYMRDVSLLQMFTKHRKHFGGKVNGINLLYSVRQEQTCRPGTTGHIDDARSARQLYMLQCSLGEVAQIITRVHVVPTGHEIPRLRASERTWWFWRVTHTDLVPVRPTTEKSPTPRVEPSRLLPSA